MSQPDEALRRARLEDADRAAHTAASHVRIRPSGLTTHGETLLNGLTSLLGV